MISKKTKRPVYRGQIDSNKISVPETYKRTEKTPEEFRIDAYRMWLEIFKRESKMDRDVLNNYSEYNAYYLISPYGNIIPLSWLEINVLEEYMQNFIERLENNEQI